MIRVEIVGVLSEHAMSGFNIVHSMSWVISYWIVWLWGKGEKHEFYKQKEL